WRASLEFVVRQHLDVLQNRIRIDRRHRRGWHLLAGWRRDCAVLTAAAGDESQGKAESRHYAKRTSEASKKLHMRHSSPYARGHVALERALSKLGITSRSEAGRRIKNGEVTVNGRVVRNPLIAVHPERDRIEVAGRLAPRRAWRTIAFHKPRGTVTT